jgi:hypothetical protein
MTSDRTIPITGVTGNRAARSRSRILLPQKKIKTVAGVAHQSVSKYAQLNFLRLFNVEQN